MPGFRLVIPFQKTGSEIQLYTSKNPSFTCVNLVLLLTGLITLNLSPACFAAGYHVYDWKGDAKIKNGTSFMECTAISA